MKKLFQKSTIVCLFVLMIFLPLAAEAQQIGSGTYGTYSIVVDSSGLVTTWGSNGSGELGDGTNNARSIPGYVDMGLYGGTAYLGDNPADKKRQALVEGLCYESEVGAVRRPYGVVRRLLRDSVRAGLVGINLGQRFPDGIGEANAKAPAPILPRAVP